MAEPAECRVTVVYSPAARDVHKWTVTLQAGATVLDAIRHTTLSQDFPSLDLPSTTVGVWGRKCSPTQVLRDGDRVELYRPLLVDPKVARRERFRKQGARAAGLFARKP